VVIDIRYRTIWRPKWMGQEQQRKWQIILGGGGGVSIKDWEDSVYVKGGRVSQREGFQD